jgi:hypothetical protein
MSVPPTSAPDIVNNGFKSLGPKAPPHIVSCTGSCGGGVNIINGEKSRVLEFLNARGAGVVVVTQNEHGVGDCKSPAPGRRGTKSFMDGTGDTSKPTIIKMCGADGTGITVDSGGGRNPTITMMLSDGSAGLLITKGRVAYWADGAEHVLYGEGGPKETTTYFVVQERNPSTGKVLTPTAVA